MLQARGSLEELLDDLNVCEDEECKRSPKSRGSSRKAGAHKLISGYIRFLRTRTAKISSQVQESPAEYESSGDELDDLFFGRFNSSSL
jgi:hypothetical protein